MNRRKLTLALVGMGMMGVASQASAAVIAQFDFFNTAGDTFGEPFYENYHIAQTFTTTSGGVVTSVDIPVVSAEANNPDHLPLNVSIQAMGTPTVNGPQPTGTPLASGSLAYDDSQFGSPFIEWINIPMTATTLTAGETYALVATVGSPSDTYPNQAYTWYSKSGKDAQNQLVDLYTGGKLLVSVGDEEFTNGVYDVAFRINANLPEPASLALVGLAAGGLLLRRRRG